MKTESNNPTDHELGMLVHSMWWAGLNLEAGSISVCMASRMRVEHTPAFCAAIHMQLKRMVREGELSRQPFLKGRPFYSIA